MLVIETHDFFSILRSFTLRFQGQWCILFWRSPQFLQDSPNFHGLQQKAHDLVAGPNLTSKIESLVTVPFWTGTVSLRLSSYDITFFSLDIALMEAAAIV